MGNTAVTVARIAWLALLTLLTSALVSPVIANFAPFFILGPFPFLGALLVWLLVDIAAAVLLATFASLGVAIIALSVAGLTFGLLDYFLLQRFASPIDRPHFVRRAPLMLPLMCFSCFVSSMLALGFFGAWYMAALPFVIWIALGFLSAEIAIQGCIVEMKRFGHDCDRSHAIGVVNLRQGRTWYDYYTRHRLFYWYLLHWYRYPFP